MKDMKRMIGARILLPVVLLLTLTQACSSERRNDSTMQTPIQSATPAPTPAVTPTPVATPTPATVESKSENPSELFAYDPSKPLNVQESSVKKTTTGVKIHEISYDAYDQSKNSSGKISAYLVMPKGKGPFPCVLYFHWLGRSNANKNEFLDEATALADKGIAGVLIDGYFPWKETPIELEKDKSMVVYQVIELKRAVDYITSLPNIDSKRIGYVGHDYGAMFGSVLSGVDNRISNFVFIAGMGNFSDWFLQYWVSLNEDGRQKYRLGMSKLDPVNYIRNAAPAKVFFQFANKDFFVSKENADEFYEASSQPKEVKFYDAGHDMESEQARLDRQKWLIDNLT